MSFASEPGRDDGNPPPANIVIPDDARELDRDVLAYHREQRARRRRQRFMRLFGPVGKRGWGGNAAILPLIAACLALSMLAGAMLSVITMSPAAAPTWSPSPNAAVPGTRSPGLTALPAGLVTLNGRPVDVRTLKRSAIALVPENCDCGAALSRLASQAKEAGVSLYFAASGTASTQLRDLTARYGRGVAVAVDDSANVLGAAYHPRGLTVLLVHSDATADVRRNLQPAFNLGPDLRELVRTG